jgi:hypothetical protein
MSESIPSITTKPTNQSTSQSQPSPTNSPKSPKSTGCPKCSSQMTVSFMYTGKYCSKCKHKWEVLPEPAGIYLNK